MWLPGMPLPAEYFKPKVLNYPASKSILQTKLSVYVIKEKKKLISKHSLIINTINNVFEEYNCEMNKMI
jgi:hypothetical protein